MMKYIRRKYIYITCMGGRRRESNRALLKCSYTMKKTNETGKAMTARGPAEWVGRWKSDRIDTEGK